MREIGNKFWVVGTNPNKYFDNYMSHINILNMFDEISVDNTNLVVNEKTLDYRSRATLRQNLIAWEAMGFIYKIDTNKYIKIIPTYTEDQLITISFFSMFLPFNNEEIKKYRDTILIKLNYLINPNEDLIKKYNLSKSKGLLTEIDIKQETGKFENKILENKKYKKIITALFKGD